MALKVYFEGKFLHYGGNKCVQSSANIIWDKNDTRFSIETNTGPVIEDQLLSETVDKLDAVYPDKATFETAIDDFFVNASSSGGGASGLYISAGTVSEPSIVYNTGLGTVTLGEGTFRFFHTVDYSGSITEHTIASDTLAISDNVATYLIASYNSGTPVYTTTEDIASVDDAINAVVNTVYRSGDNFSIIDWDSPGLGLPNKTHRRLIETERFSRVFGFDISEYGTRNMLVSAGKVWQGVHPNSLAEVNSVDHTYYLWTNNGDTTFSWAQINQYTNMQYDPKTGTLATLTDGEYGVIWLYRSMSTNSTTVHVILGNQGYDLNGAKAAQPVEVPQLFDTNTLLIGKIIVLKNAATATEIDSAFETTFAASVTTNHGGLTGLTGGYNSVHDHLPVYNTDGTTPILVVDKTNNRVGIGTDSPTSQLEVDGTGLFKFNDNIRGIVVENELADNYNVISLQGDVQVWNIASGNSSETAISVANKFAIFNSTSGSVALIVEPTANNVGIGTTSPEAKLHVIGGVKIGAAGTASTEIDTVVHGQLTGNDGVGSVGGTFNVRTVSVGTEWANSNTRVFCSISEWQHGGSGAFGSASFTMAGSFVNTSGDLLFRFKIADFSGSGLSWKIDYMLVRA